MTNPHYGGDRTQPADQLLSGAVPNLRGHATRHRRPHGHARRTSGVPRLALYFRDESLRPQQRRKEEMRMLKTLTPILLALSVLAGIAGGIAGTANAADCQVTGWINSGQGGRPIWHCPDEAR